MNEFTVEPKDSPCSHCHNGGTWIVNGPVRQEQLFFSEADAQIVANELNAVFDAGAASTAGDQRG